MKNATPLYVACQKGYLEIVKYLIKHGADMTICFQNGFSPLHIAAQDQALEVVKYLISKGADVLAKSHQGKLASEVTDVEEIVNAINEAIANLAANKKLTLSPAPSKSSRKDGGDDSKGRGKARSL
jgi:ankyrin repeat protein